MVGSKFSTELTSNYMIKRKALHRKKQFFFLTCYLSKKVISLSILKEDISFENSSYFLGHLFILHFQDLHTQTNTPGQKPVGSAISYNHNTKGRIWSLQVAGSPPKTTKDSTSIEGILPALRLELKFLTLPGIETGLSAWKAVTLPTKSWRRTIDKERK